MQAAVIAQDVWKIFEPGSVKAVRAATLALEPGELVAVIGPSGSGKTTLLTMLGAMLSPTRGKVTVAGHALGSLSDRELVELRRKHIGFVFQSFNLIASLTALENVEVILKLQKQRRTRPRAAAALEAVGLQDRMNFLPRDMSNGQKQRVAIARAIVHNPDVILADEPTAALDSDNGLAVTRILATRAAEAGTAVVVVTHDIRLRSMMDRIFLMEDGYLSEEGMKQETVEGLVLKEA